MAMLQDLNTLLTLGIVKMMGLVDVKVLASCRVERVLVVAS